MRSRCVDAKGVHIALRKNLSEGGILKYMLYKFRSVLLLIFITIYSLTFSPTRVDATCGSIIAPEDWYAPSGEFFTTPITNCINPFNETTDVASPYTLRINGNTVGEGDTFIIGEEGITQYEIEGESLLSGFFQGLFRHDGEDYMFVDMMPSEPGESDYRVLAQEFFDIGVDIEPYIAAMLDGGLVYSYDEETQNTFWQFYDYVGSHFVPKFPILEPGTYTLVLREYELIMTEHHFLKKFLTLLVPTAHAQSYPEYVFTVTFTVVAPEEEKGISNILFIPGIQASRLYTEIDGEEEKLWEPFGDDDVEMLRMTDTGESINAIYTKDVLEEVGGTSIGGNIYKDFLKYLSDIDGPLAGPVIETFPYDWRYDVFNIVQNGTKVSDTRVEKPIEKLMLLATTSVTDKVTIIAHSNGGLLAKAIMLKLEEEGKQNLIDKVIFIASPHIGTPKGLAALLHGYDQEHLGGLISSDEKVRSVMKNMPGVYGLLPSRTYIESLSTPLLSFDDSSTTKKYRDAYGFTISNSDEYERFLNGDEGREESGNSINIPSTVNAEMLSSALDEHRNKLDTWSAPEGVEVFNIVGTGLPTPNSIEYQEFKEMYCNGGIVASCSELITKIEPVLHFTRYGDETVVSKSAENVAGKTQYLNLRLEGSGISNSNNEHANITESRTTKTIVDHILYGSTTDEIEFVSSTEPTFSDDDMDIYRIHSPVHIYLRDDMGNITGKTETNGDWFSEIPGSDYFEAGGVKYALVPSVGRYTITIEGEGKGVYTHSMSVLSNESEVEHHTLTASVTPSSIIEYSKNDTGEFSIINVDENGDGEIDAEMTLTGEIIQKEVTYDDLKSTIKALKLPKKFEQPLLMLVKQAEKLSLLHNKKHKVGVAEDVLLQVVAKQLEWYQKVKLITESQFRGIKNIIEGLITNNNEK